METIVHSHDNVEELSAPFEIAKLIRRLGALDDAVVSQLLEYMRKAITVTIERCMKAISCEAAMSVRTGTVPSGAF